jgi:predicted SAM-dependent methyltransferase
MKNPIINELKNLSLISKKNILLIYKKTRDKKIKVLKDIKTKVVFLEKYITTKHYYSSLKYKDDERKISEKSTKKKANIKTLNGHVKILRIEDDIRRVKQFAKDLNNKNILDFGCGWGGFLKNIKNFKSLCGVELRNECINYIKKRCKKINIKNNINDFNKKFDIITMFHVLEHIPFQVKTLKILKSKLKKNGKIIIEVPHAEDFLILQDDLKNFKDFTFWSEHLILHTNKTLRTMLKRSGFKNIKIQYFQRYNFANHLGWFLKKKPGGHIIYKNIINEKLDNAYKENLVRLKKTDTLIATAKS